LIETEGETDVPPPDLERILYVDDEADLREIVHLALESVGGFRVKVCDSGPCSLEEAERFRPDLILLDVMMPGMDGPETLRRFRGSSAAATPVVFMTAKVQARDLERYREIGAADVIVKPFDPMTLADEVRRIWRRWTERRD
jgi:DNA-binding response OmpR family regulator